MKILWRCRLNLENLPHKRFAFHTSATYHNITMSKTKRNPHSDHPPSISRIHTAPITSLTANDEIQRNFEKFSSSLAHLLAAPQDEIVKAVGEEQSKLLQALRDIKTEGEIPWISSSSINAQNSVPSSKWPPMIPFINNPEIRQQAFTHRSFILGENASMPGVENQHYERLEYLGDAYLQSIASHILYTRFPTQREGALSSMRQELVCNKTLMEYAALYNLANYLREGKNQQITQQKTIADCFEAYIGGLVIDRGELEGVRVISAWLKDLFEPKLVDMERRHGAVQPIDKMARQTLATICGGNSSKIEYEWTDGAGGNKGGFWITVKLTGWGFQKRVLGKGWGPSKS
ncbi:ribonuclease III domain-containing protein [Geopyxis carbonaria]|nr:ribonuclease III domain-containing protein [Geopyxis carbonaria]